MVFGVAVCKKDSNKVTCSNCWKPLRKGEALLIYKDQNNKFVETIHIRCFIDSIRTQIPDFFRKYILELI